jgi:branched-chain amino acid transport system substrate-binding protein
MDILEKWGKELGLEIVYRGEAPAGTIDLTPWAIKITQAKPDIYYHEAGLTEAIGIIPVLEKLGFNQTVIGSMSFLESEFSKAAALSRGIIKDFYMGDRYMYNYKGIEKDIPEYGRLMQAVKKYGIHGFSTGHNTVVGWIMGMIFEKACRKVGWPATRAALLGALETLEIDTRGLSGGPIHYSPTDHHGPSWWRVFKWDFKANEFKPFTDWWEFKLEQYMEK